jgi:DNA-binding transcriptional regulator YiaG
MNVDIKAVQAWEQELRHPSGPALRLMEIAEKNPELLRSI